MDTYSRRSLIGAAASSALLLPAHGRTTNKIGSREAATAAAQANALVGHVWELWYDGVGWHKDDVTAATGAPPCVGRPNTYTWKPSWTSIQDQHMVFLSTDQHIHEFWFDTGAWTFRHSDLTAATNAPAALSTPFGCTGGKSDTQRVVYAGANGSIQELALDLGTWHWYHTDLTQTTGMPPGVGPIEIADSVNHKNHVIYRTPGPQGHLYHLWYDGQWHGEDLMSVLSGLPLATFYCGHFRPIAGTLHIFYTTPASGLHELAYDGQWHHNNLSAPFGNLPVQYVPFSYVETVGNVETQRVLFQLNDHVHELSQTGTTGWIHQDISALAGGPAWACSNPCGFRFERGQNISRHVIVRDRDTWHVNDLWYDGAWHRTNVTASIGAPLPQTGDPCAYYWDMDKTGHIIYGA